MIVAPTKPFDMDNVDVKVLAADDQSFRFFTINGLSSLSERMKTLQESLQSMSREVAANRDRLVEIDIKGTHGLGDLKERMAAHEKWLDDVRKQLSDHNVHCPMVDRLAACESAIQDFERTRAARDQLLKGFPEMQRQVQELTVAAAENTGAKGQKESDWRTTLIMIGMLLSTMFSLLALLKKG